MKKIDFKTDNKNINDLIDKIKKKSGKNVEIFFGEMTIGANETLVASIVDGTPLITIKNNHAFTEEEIYHELFHFFIKFENKIHYFNIGGSLLDFLKNNIQEPTLILSKTHSILHHAYFFHKMISNKFSPGKNLEKQLDDCIDQYGTVYQNDRDVHNVLDVWHIALSLSDKNLSTSFYLEKLKELNQDNYDQGIKLLEMSKKFTEPNNESELFCDILKELLGYSNSVEYLKNNSSVLYR